MKYDGLHSDMMQAQQQLAGVRSVTKERDVLHRQVKDLKDEMARLARDVSQAQEHEALAKEQLRQTEMLARDLQRQECESAFMVQQAEVQAQGLQADKAELEVRLSGAEQGLAERQQQLEESFQRLDGLTIVKEALERQMQSMADQAKHVQAELVAAEAKVE